MEPLLSRFVTMHATEHPCPSCRFSASNYGAKVAIIELPFAFIPDEKHGGAGGTCAAPSHHSTPRHIKPRRHETTGLKYACICGVCLQSAVRQPLLPQFLAL